MKIGDYETNNIYNEDCYEAIKKIPDKSVDLIYTDPPYLFGKDGKTNFGSRLKEQNVILDTTAKQIEKISYGFDLTILEHFVRVMKYIHIYIWCNDAQIIDYINFFVNKYNCDYKILGWVKSNPMPMYEARMLDDVEYCLLFVEKGKKKFKGISTFENSFKFYHEPINQTDKKLYGHPTIKPLKCVKNHIEKSTNVNDVVLDCFMGSGTTAVACKETGRQYLGFEIDKEYFKIAQDRLNGIEKSGQTTLDLFSEQTSMEFEDE